MKIRVKLVIGIVLSGIIALLLVYLFIYNKPHTNYETEEVTSQLAVKELYHSFLSNKPLADSLYTGKMILIEGILTKTETADSMVTAVFVLDQGMFGDEGVRCVLLPKSYDLITRFKGGDRVKIKGFCSGYNDTDVILEHCSILN
ncbi:MAG: hypothetical protein IH596_15150 [Bacteroidales bacterium]|nr:hypothetical protein [Bacteroidales bacterium]